MVVDSRPRVHTRWFDSDVRPNPTALPNHFTHTARSVCTMMRDYVEHLDAGSESDSAFGDEVDNDSDAEHAEPIEEEDGERESGAGESGDELTHRRDAEKSQSDNLPSNTTQDTEVGGHEEDLDDFRKKPDASDGRAGQRDSAKPLNNSKYFIGPKVRHHYIPNDRFLYNEKKSLRVTKEQAAALMGSLDTKKWHDAGFNAKYFKIIKIRDDGDEATYAVTFIIDGASSHDKYCLHRLKARVATYFCGQALAKKEQFPEDLVNVLTKFPPSTNAMPSISHWTDVDMPKKNSLYQPPPSRRKDAVKGPLPDDASKGTGCDGGDEMHDSDPPTNKGNEPCHSITPSGRPKAKRGDDGLATDPTGFIGSESEDEDPRPKSKMLKTNDSSTEATTVVTDGDRKKAADVPPSLYRTSGFVRNEDKPNAATSVAEKPDGDDFYNYLEKSVETTNQLIETVNTCLLQIKDRQLELQSLLIKGMRSNMRSRVPN